MDRFWATFDFPLYENMPQINGVPKSDQKKIRKKHVFCQFLEIFSGTLGISDFTDHFSSMLALRFWPNFGSKMHLYENQPQIEHEKMFKICSLFVHFLFRNLMLAMTVEKEHFLNLNQNKIEKNGPIFDHFNPIVPENIRYKKYFFQKKRKKTPFFTFFHFFSLFFTFFKNLNLTSKKCTYKKIQKNEKKWKKVKKSEKNEKTCFLGHFWVIFWLIVQNFCSKIEKNIRYGRLTPKNYFYHYFFCFFTTRQKTSKIGL